MPIDPKNLPRDFGVQLDKISQKLDAFAKKAGSSSTWSFAGLKAAQEAMGELEHSAGNLNLRLREMEKNSEQNTQNYTDFKKKLEETEAAMGKLGGQTSKLKAGAGELTKVFDKFGKSIVVGGLSAFTYGINQLYKGIYKVYDLQERWTKLIGTFNLKVGTAGASMAGTNKQMMQWEGSIRGLTGAMGAGADMFAEYLQSFGYMTENNKEASAFSKTMLGLARGLNLGGEGAGKLAKMMSVLGTSEVFDPKNTKHLKEVNDATLDTFATVSNAAKHANAPVNQFFQEFVKAKDWVAEFGKSGVQAISQAMVYAKKLGISLASLQKFQSLTDTFDEAATRVAKMNTVFGTSINAMEVMLEQDPSKRFEKIRSAMLQQGKTFDTLSRMERKIIAEQTGLAMDEVNAFLKSGDTLEQYEEKRAKTQAAKLQAEKQIQKAMSKTAQTLLDFSGQWDRVTMAITKLIKPFTDVLGLTNSGQKGAKSFSQVMVGLFDRMIKFINEVAANKDWQGFMKKLADDAVKLGKNISDFATGNNLKEWLEVGVKAGKDFYTIMKEAFAAITAGAKVAAPVVKFLAKHLDKIVIAWGALQVGKVAMGLGSLAGAGGAAMGGGMALAGAAGAGVGYFGAQAAGLGSNASAGAGVGGGIGGALGSIAGPLGAAIGIAAGGVIGGIIGKYVGDDTKGQRKDVEGKISKILERRAFFEKEFADKQEEKRKKEIEATNVVEQLTKHMGKNKDIVIDLGEKERETLANRIDEMNKLGTMDNRMLTIMGELTKSDGPMYLTSKQLELLKSESDKYTKTLSALNAETTKYFEDEKRKASQKFDEEDKRIKREKVMHEEAMERKKEELDAASKQLSFWDKANLTDKFIKVAKLEKEMKDEGKKFQEKSEKELLSLRREQAKKEFELTLRSKLVNNDKFTEFRNSEAGKTGTMEEAVKKFARTEAGKAILGPDADVIGKTADGGIAYGPQKRLVGEAGPEAIVPLKALVSGGDSPTASTVGANVAERIVQMASGRTSSGGNSGPQSITIEVPVMIDSQELSRIIARRLLTDVSM